MAGPKAKDALGTRVENNPRRSARNTGKSVNYNPWAKKRKVDEREPANVRKPEGDLAAPNNRHPRSEDIGDEADIPQRPKKLKYTPAVSQNAKAAARSPTPPPSPPITFSPLFTVFTSTPQPSPLAGPPTTPCALAVPPQTTIPGPQHAQLDVSTQTSPRQDCAVLSVASEETGVSATDSLASVNRGVSGEKIGDKKVGLSQTAAIKSEDEGSSSGGDQFRNDQLDEDDYSQDDQFDGQSDDSQSEDEQNHNKEITLVAPNLLSPVGVPKTMDNKIFVLESDEDMPDPPAQPFRVSDVASDGNCFWRAFALAHFHNEALWPMVKIQTHIYFNQVTGGAYKNGEEHPRKQLYGALNKGLNRRTNLLVQLDLELSEWTSDEMFQVVADLYSVELLVARQLSRDKKGRIYHDFTPRGIHNRKQVFLCHDPKGHWKALEWPGARPWDRRWTRHVDNEYLRKDPVFDEAGNELPFPRPFIPEPRPAYVSQEEMDGVVAWAVFQNS